MFRMHETISSEHADLILEMMQYITDSVGGDCIQFKEVSSDYTGDYVMITATGGTACSSTDCCSELGRTGSRPYQVLNLEILRDENFRHR